MRDLCKAWDAKATLRFGAPRFKKRGEGDALRLPQDCRCDGKAGLVQLTKLGAVRLRHSREAPGALKNVMLRQEGGRWVASLQTERELDVVPSAADAAVGLDFGAATTIMPSTGAPIELPKRIGRYERRSRRLALAVSRKKKGSANRKKAVSRLAQCHRRIAAIRRDFLHDATSQLAREHALVAIEDLEAKRMTASAVGTREAPGRNVRAKAGLNRTILRNGWSMARSMLEYKAARGGVMLMAVPPAYTSQECSACGHIAAENRKTQAAFACVACDHVENADRNAAKVILRRGQEIGSDGRPASTAGYAGTYTCEGGRLKPPRPRPRSAAPARPVGLAVAGTTPGAERSWNLHS